jgi:hypothetical protein
MDTPTVRKAPKMYASPSGLYTAPPPVALSAPADLPWWVEATLPVVQVEYVLSLSDAIPCDALCPCPLCGR